MGPVTCIVTGIVTGIRAEARLLRRLPLVACAGAEPATAARALLAAGATRLLSFGLAGGLDPALAPGTVVVASVIITADGQRIPTDAGWAAAVARPGMVRAPLLGGAQPLLSVADKAAAFHRTGAAAVDLESAAVAQVAAHAGVPVLAIRAIADSATRAVPAQVAALVDAQGRVRPRAVVRALARHPAAMLALAGDAHAAMTALRALVRVAAGRIQIE